MPSIRPFQFTGLPRLTREQVAVQQSLATYLSFQPFSDDFATSLAGMIEGYFKQPCNVSAPDLKTIARRELGTVVPAMTCLLVVGAAPTEHKILVDLDTSLAAYCIDRLLGGSGDVGRIQRPLTEIEEGVLSFMLLKVLAHFQNGWSTGRELALTLDRFASKLEDVSDLVDPVSHYCMIGARIGIGKRVGYARLFLPNGLITQTFGAAAGEGKVTPAELDYMRRVLRSMGERTVEAKVEIATLDLSADDVASIEVGDIIVLENHEVTNTPQGLTGSAFVRIGDGNNGGLRGRLLNEGETHKLQITEIVVREEPAEVEMAGDDGEGEGEGDNLAETSGLLRDVQAPVVVELGRLKMNTTQVAKLRSGQILRLPRGPTDPVNLVVNGKLFARGELIEVDGELGVRLIQVVGT
jgi:flagellar motor switch protein FliM